MLEQYYPKEFLSPDDGGGVSEAYEDKVTIDNEVIEVRVEPQGDGKPPKVFPKGNYKQWGEPVFADKLTEQLVHNSKKAMEVLKNNNENTKAMQELQTRLSELEKEKLRNEGTIEALQKVRTPDKQEKKLTSEPEEFDVVKKAYGFAGVDNEEDWDDLTPSQRFKAESRANQEFTKHNNLQFMKQFNETSAKTNQEFMQEQKLSSMIVQAGHDPQAVKELMKQNGVTYSEQGVSFYINSINANKQTKSKTDTIDELNKRTEIINRNHDTKITGAQGGFEFVTPQKQKEREYVEAVSNSEVDHNAQASQILRKFRNNK